MAAPSSTHRRDASADEIDAIVHARDGRVQHRPCKCACIDFEASSQSAERAPKTAEAACHGLRCCTYLVHACTILFEAPNTQGPMSNEKRRSFEVRRSNISSRELHAPSPRIRVRKSNVLFSTPSVARANEKDGRFEVQAWKCRSLGFDAPPFFIDAPQFLIGVPRCIVRACTNLVRNRNPVKGVRFIHLDE